MSTNIQTPLFDLGPMQVFFDGVDVGATKDGVSVSGDVKGTGLVSDQSGTEPLDYVITGQAYKVKFTLCETQKKDNWKIAFPHSKLLTSGPNKAVYQDLMVGKKLSAVAKLLRLHPNLALDADKAGDHLFYKAVCMSAVEIKYDAGTQIGLAVELMILPDTSVNPARYWLHGDPAIGVVAATLVQASYTGTGNGVLSAITAGALAVTETLTATAVTAAVNGGTFHVAGSVSGSLGLAFVGTPFITPKGNFTINDGATDFIVGDVFTLTSVGANYA
jgi:hypothetical protein